MKRRTFLQQVGLTSTVIPSMHSISNLHISPIQQPFIEEPSRKIPVVEDVDVLVCGAGPAGVTAALAAARMGAKTRLLEVNSCLGGVWTAGQLAWVWDMGKPGMSREIIHELDKRHARVDTPIHPNQKTFTYDIESLKLLLEEMCDESGVAIRLHTRVTSALKNERNQLTVVITESKSGREAWRAKSFVDATGDGDLGALAGCEFDIGEEGTGKTQPMTFMALITVQSAEALQEFISFWKGIPEHRKKHTNFLQELHRAGVEPSYGHPTLFQVNGNLLALMINHEYGVSAIDAEQITRATIHARAEIQNAVIALNQLGGAWKDIQLVSTAEYIGVREGRRIHGRYTVTVDDLIQGRHHDDAVCRVYFGVDVHSTNPKKDKTLSNKGVRMKPYDIPMRALIANDVDGLLMAGRCISGDWLAHASYRVTGNAVPMGEAAGVAAALAARSSRLSHQIPWTEVQSGLQRINTNRS